MPQLSVPVQLLFLLHLLIFQTIDTVKPIWRTKVTDVRKNATSRTQRASSGLLSNSNSYQNYAAQKPYYTRPEDFKIPDYRTVKSNLLNGFQSNFQPNVFNQNNRYLQQQFVPDQKYFQPQFIPNWHPSNQEMRFQNTNRFLYNNGPQLPSAPFYPQNNGFPNQNNIRNQWYIPPNALPYWEGAGPIPPQGAYGPTTSTKEPMKPSVNPENYEGTIPMQPSVNPEMVTTVSQNNHLTKLISEQPQHELYNPSTEVSAGFPSTFTSVMPTIFATQNNPFATSSTFSQITSENTKTNIFLKETSTTPYLESFNEGYSSSETSQTHPYPIIALETTFKPEITSESNTMPRISTIASDFKEYLEEDSAKTAIITEPNTLTPQKSNTFYYPRPATSQVYQPPGQRPDEFTQHIDVNFIKPNRTCIWPTCGIDADKVSIYKPENGNGSRGPTLLISNVVKDGTVRHGYIPPIPHVVSEYPQLSTSTEYYNDKFVPGSINYPKAEIPGTYDLDKSTSIEPIHLEIPSGPHVFMPPQNFPAPSTQTQVPPSEVTLEITTGAGYSPTAKTIATSSSEIYSSFSSSSPHPTTSFQTTSAFPNTLPHFESTNTITELTTDATTEVSKPSIYSTQPNDQNLITSKTFVPSSSTFETILTSPTTASSQQPSSSSTFVTTPAETPTSKEISSLSTLTQNNPTTPLSTTTTTPADTTLEQLATTSTEVPTRIEQSSTVSSSSQITTPENKVKNKVRGKVHVVCKEDGIEFSATTLFPFNGEIFANDRKRVPSCSHKIVNSIAPKVFLPFIECGVKNAGDQKDSRAQYHMQVVVVIQQADGTSTIQSFMAQCIHQRILYNKQTLPHRIEEALEELKLVATKLEQKAPLPQVEMKIVIDEHHQLGPEVSEVDIGMPLAVQWKLVPESDAYGFFVKNCIVKDDIINLEHKMIDEFGCSTDLSIFAHPHYDTYHDTASSHLWAFKVPDHTRLRIRCDVTICSDIPSSSTNISSCSSIPTPPFCPDLITSPSNSILYDAEGAFLKQRRHVAGEITQSVRAALCTGSDCDLQPLGYDKYCFGLHWVAASTGLSFASLIFAIIMHIVVKVRLYRK